MHVFNLLSTHSPYTDHNDYDFVFIGPQHVLDSRNGSLCCRLKKTSSEEGTLIFQTSSKTSPSLSDRTPSASSDSGLSVASQGQTRAGQKRTVQDNSSQTGKLVPLLDFEITQPLLEVMAELAARGVAGGEPGLGFTINGEVSSSQRETDILDDGFEGDEEAAPVLKNLSSSSICSCSSEKLPETQNEYSTHSWVQQQQMVDVTADNHLDVDGRKRLSRRTEEGPSPLVAPDPPGRGISSREVVQRVLVIKDSMDNRDATHNILPVSNAHTSCQDEDLLSLTTDIDKSIEQLNQLILDLDPTYIPVPTCCAPLPRRSASLQTNGLSHKGNTHLSGTVKTSTQ